MESVNFSVEKTGYNFEFEKNSKNFILKSKFLIDNNNLNESFEKKEVKNNLIYNFYCETEKNLKNKLKRSYSNESTNSSHSSNEDLLLNINNNFNNNFSNEKILKLSPFLIQEQEGSRFLQNKLKMNKQFTNDVYFPYLIKYYEKNQLIQLICSQFGNYLFQVIIEVLTENNLNLFLKLISNNFYNISIDIYGTRFIQKLICVLNPNTENFNLFLFILKQNLQSLLETSHGNHAIQKFIEIIFNYKKYYKKDFDENDFFNNKINFFFDYFFKNFEIISVNKFGCITIQKLILFSKGKIKIKLYKLIKEKIIKIIEKQYGTFLLQFLIEKENTFFKTEIIPKILQNFSKICKTKFSSNSIEKCLESEHLDISKIFIKKILEDNNIFEFIIDPYGNYIIQKALLIANEKEFNFILKEIGKHYEEIKKVNFGKKLLIKLENLYTKLKEYEKKKKN